MWRLQGRKFLFSTASFSTMLSFLALSFQILQRLQGKSNLARALSVTLNNYPSRTKNSRNTDNNKILHLSFCTPSKPTIMLRASFSTSSSLQEDGVSMELGQSFLQEAHDIVQRNMQSLSMTKEQLKVRLYKQTTKSLQV